MSCASDGHDTDEELSRLEQLLDEEGVSEGDVSDSHLLDDDSLLGLGEAEEQRVKPALSKAAKASTPVPASASLQRGGSTHPTRPAPTRGSVGKRGRPLIAAKTTEALGGRGEGKMIALNRKSNLVRYVPDSLPQVELPQLARQQETVKRGAKGGHRPYGRYFSEPSLLLEQPPPPKVSRQSEDLRGMITGNRMKKASILGSHQLGSDNPQRPHSQPSVHSRPSRVVRESDWDCGVLTSHQTNRTGWFPEAWTRLPNTCESVESGWQEGEGLSEWGEQPWEAEQYSGRGPPERGGRGQDGVGRSRDHNQHLFAVDVPSSQATPPTSAPPSGSGFNPFVPHTSKLPPNTLRSHVTNTTPSAMPTGLSYDAHVPSTVSFNVFGPSAVSNSSPSKATASCTVSHQLQPIPASPAPSQPERTVFGQQAASSYTMVRPEPSIFAQRPGIVPFPTTHNFTLKHLRTGSSAKHSFSLDHL